jgi:hypothetical protein
MPNIAVINESLSTTDSDIQMMLPAFALQWNTDLKAVWGVDDATFTFFEKGVKPYLGTWWLVFLDTSDQADALAYHDLTDHGQPISKVFVKTIQADSASLSVGATHELCEMAVDPWLNRGYQDPNGTFWAGEVCDPVGDDEYGYTIGEILVTDFVTPAWFAQAHFHSTVDFKIHAHKSFEILSGGYAQFFDPHNGWQQVTGNKAVRSRRADAPRGSRRDRRTRRFKNKGCKYSARFTQP